MAPLREWLLRLWGSLYGNRTDRELEEELRFHVESASQDARRRDGAEDHVREALLRTGGVAQSLKLMRDQRGLPWLEDAMRDLRQAFRILLRARGFATVTVLTLGLGISASTVMFSVLSAVVLKPLPYRDSRSLVLLWTDDVERQLHQTLVPHPLYMEWKQRSGAFSELGYATPNTPITLSGFGEAERLDAAWATASVFTALGVSPLAGRSYSSGEERNGDRVAVVGHALAERRFGSATAAIGAVLLIDGEPTTVIGVMPASFAFPTLEIQVWRPLGNRRARMFVIGRLRAEVPLSNAREEMVTIGRQLADAYPDLAADPDFPGFATNLVQLDDYVAGRETRVALWILLGAALLMMLIACTNAGTLILTRAIARRRELALQVALGATQSRLVRQMLIESAVLALVSAAVGIGSASWLLRGLLVTVGADIPRSDAIVVDGYVLTFATSLAILCSLFLSSLTAWRVHRVSLDGALREGGRSQGVGLRRRGLQQALIVVEVAVTLALVCGASLVFRSLGEVRRLPLGFDTANTLLFRMVVPNEFSTEQRRRFFNEAIVRLQRLPGVRTAGVIGNLFPVSIPDTGVIVEGGHESRGRVPILDDVASPQTFSALRVALRDGRFFGPEDTSDSVPVAIVNERFVREFWGDKRAVGRRFQFLDKRAGGAWITIIGVITDMRRHRLEDEPVAQLFLPFSQEPSRGADIVVQAQVPPLSLASSVTRAMATVDDNVPVYRISTLSQRLDEFVTTRLFHVVLLSLFAGAGVLLAAIGIYGLIRHDVSQRTQEIGVRVALGASRRDVVILVLRNGLILTGMGILLGWFASLSLAGVMGSLVYGVSTRDPVTFLIAPIVLLTITIIACLEPTWRALRLDPFKALRPE